MPSNNKMPGQKILVAGERERMEMMSARFGNAGFFYLKRTPTNAQKKSDLDVNYQLKYSDSVRRETD